MIKSGGGGASGAIDAYVYESLRIRFDWRE
jgi:hypothetical protein